MEFGLHVVKTAYSLGRFGRPIMITRTCLGPQQDNILMVLDNSNISANCNIKTDVRNKNKKYISTKWFAFVNNVNLEVGSKLRFLVSDVSNNRLSQKLKLLG
jgi:hypothetical protein